jgi:hypothetical protein
MAWHGSLAKLSEVWVEVSYNWCGPVCHPKTVEGNVSSGPIAKLSEVTVTLRWSKLRSTVVKEHRSSLFKEPLFMSRFLSLDIEKKLGICLSSSIFSPVKCPKIALLLARHWRGRKKKTAVAQWAQVHDVNELPRMELSGAWSCPVGDVLRVDSAYLILYFCFCFCLLLLLPSAPARPPLFHRRSENCEIET